MEERENKEKRRENEQKAIGPISQAAGTHPYKKHTDAFHRLPTIRQHPEKETIKKQSQTITQATETFAKLSIYSECIPHI